MFVREEESGDEEAVRYVNEQAFGRKPEADLVDKLRERGKVALSLVALKDDRIAGHILFSPVIIGSAGKTPLTLGLGPMAVLPEFQRKGIGSLLVKTGLGECRKRGYDCVVVLGHPEYYPRFGFIPAGKYGIKCGYDVPDEAFMLIELKKGVLSGCTGAVKYEPEFDEV